MSDLNLWRRCDVKSEVCGVDTVKSVHRRPTRCFAVVPWMVALAGALVGCSGADSPTPVEDAKTPTSDVATPGPSDGTVDAPVVVDAGGGGADTASDLGLGTDTGTVVPVDAPTTVDAATADATEVAAGPAPYGPWTFASDDHLAGWEIYGATSSTNECRMERDPADGGSLKITYGSPDCLLRRDITGADVHDRRIKARIRAEEGTATGVKLFGQVMDAWKDGGMRAITSSWKNFTFLFDAPGTTAGYDPAKITHFGLAFDGSGGSVWIDSIELVQDTSGSGLPTFEFDGSGAEDELGFKGAGALRSSVELHQDGYAMVRIQLTEGGAMSYGIEGAADLSRAKTMRARLRTVGSPSVQIFMKTGTSWKWHEAPNLAGLPLREWTELSWDLREIDTRDFVREWGLSVYGVAGEVGLDIDWIRFEEAPLPPPPDAGVEVGEASDAESSADADSGVADSAGL